MSLRSSTEYEIAASHHHMIAPLIRHAGEGRIQGKEGMDTSALKSPSYDVAQLRAFVVSN